VVGFCEHGNEPRIQGSHSGGYENFYYLRYNTVYYAEIQVTFQRKILPTSSGSENKASKKPARKSVDFQRTTRRYIPEDRTLYGNESSGSIKCWEILEQLSDWRLLKKDSAPWSYLIMN
jgi:hypothetical protein